MRFDRKANMVGLGESRIVCQNGFILYTYFAPTFIIINRTELASRGATSKKKTPPEFHLNRVQVMLS